MSRQGEKSYGDLWVWVFPPIHNPTGGSRPLGGCQLHDSVKADVASDLKEVCHCRLAGLFSVLSLVGTSLVVNIQHSEACKTHLAQGLNL